MVDAPNIRKAKYRETARRIISADREARKFGRSQDTISEITLALERAYKQGAAEAHRTPPRQPKPSSDRDVVDWILIPPRARAAFSRIMMWLHATQIAPNAGGLQWSGSAWAFFDKPRSSLTHHWGKTTIAPLIRLALLKAEPGEDTLLYITDLGRRTYAAYQQRDAADDSTLPIGNARAGAIDLAPLVGRRRPDDV